MFFFDGAFYPITTPLFNVEERSFLFGDGVFTTLKVANGFVENYRCHTERLERHARELRISFSPVQEEEIQELIFKNQAHKGSWRLKIIVTGGSNPDLSMQPRQGKVLATLKPFTETPFLPLKAAIYPHPVVRPFSRLKTLAYLDRFAIKQAAQEKNVDEMITTCPEGYLLETSMGNLFWIHQNDFYTPSPNLPLLYGIAIQKIEEALAEEGFKMNFQKCTVDQIPNEAYLFCCNSMIGFKPIIALNERTFARDEGFEMFLRQCCIQRLPNASLQLHGP